MRYLSLLSLIAAHSILCAGEMNLERPQSGTNIGAVPQDACSDCEEAAEYLKNVLENPKILKQLEDMLDPLCDDQPTYFGRLWCHEVVDHLDVFVSDFVINYLNNSQAFCANIGLCNPSTAGAAERFVSSLANLLRTPKTAVNEERKRKSRNIIDLLPKDACADCEKAVGALKKALNDSGLLGKLSNWQHQCATISQPLEAFACQSIVTLAFHIVGTVSYLLDDPHIFCANLGVCPFKSEVGRTAASLFVQLPKTFISSQLKQPAGAGPLCDECKKEVADFRQGFASQQFRQSVQDLLLEVCEEAAAWSYACTEWVNHHLMDVFNYLDKMLADPEKMCEALQLC